MWTNRISLWVLGLGWVVWSCPVAALDEHEKQSIREISNQAASDYENGRYESAREKFLRAYASAKVPRLAVWAARTSAKLGQLVAAYDLYAQALSMRQNELWQADIQQQAQKEAQVELEQLKPRIPRLSIVIANASIDEVTVSIDNVPLPNALLGVERLVDPGQKVIVGKRSVESVHETVSLVEGDHRQVVLQFARAKGDSPVPASKPIGPNAEQLATSFDSTSRTPSLEARPLSRDETTSSLKDQRTWGWVGVGVGASGLALGLTTGLWVAVKYGDLSGKCDPHRVCGTQFQSEVNHYETLRTLSTVGFVIAGVATAAGVTLLFTNPKQTTRARIGLFVSPSVSEIRGDF